MTILTDEFIERSATEYAERVCNGEFPVTRERDREVHYTKQQFIENVKWAISALTPASVEQPKQETVWFLEQISPPHSWLTDGSEGSWWTCDPHKARTWETKEDALVHAGKLPKEAERCYPTEHMIIDALKEPEQPSEGQSQTENFDDLMDFHRQGRSRSALMKVFSIYRKGSGPSVDGELHLERLITDAQEALYALSEREIIQTSNGMKKQIERAQDILRNALTKFARAEGREGSAPQEPK